MKKAEYVFVGAGMRNSAVKPSSVLGSFQSVFNMFNIKSSSNLAGLFSVYGREEN